MLNTNQIIKQIIKSTTLEMFTPTTNKRKPIDTNNQWPKKQKTDDVPSYDTPIYVIKHYIIDKAQWDLTSDQIKSLFKTIRIGVLDDKEVDKNNNVIPHYHILGEAKVTQRKMRDWSLNNLRAAGVKGGLEAKGFFLTARVKNIESNKHFQNTIEYLKRKNGTFTEDASVTFGPLQNPVWRALDEAEEPTKYSLEEMAEFKRRFPLINSWKKVVAQKRLSKFVTGQLEGMEAQRKYEENIRELTSDEKHLLLPNIPIISHAKNFRNQLINHDQNSGVCLILCGGALMCKSTINRIIAESFGEYAVWPGSQWIQRDPLKFDTAARQGISTIVVEEMQWIDIQHRVTLEKTINSIKEQLTGAGLDVRLAKTKSSLQDDIKFKMDYLLISMNETDYVNYNTLTQLINSKPEFRRRFLVINMDDPKYANIIECRNRSNNNWIGNEQQMEWLAGKCVNNTEGFNEIQDLHEEMIFRRNEVNELVAFLDANPEIFGDVDDDIIPMTPEEVVQEDVCQVLKDITNKVVIQNEMENIQQNLNFFN